LDQKDENTPKVSIGLPVYNGEKFIRKRLESILSQSLKNFELIISDNFSTDSTLSICKEFEKKDKRIRLFQQDNNIGVIRNFYFVLEKANAEYFVWAGVDDIWLPQFLEKNVDFLEKNFQYVGSVSRIEKYGKKITPNSKGKFKKIRYFSYGKYPSSGSYEDRIKFYLRFWSNENLYAVFRTKELEKSIIKRRMSLIDKALILNILRFGEIKILDEVLMHRYTEGLSQTASVTTKIKEYNDYGLIGRIFSALPFSIWCAKNLGMKIFLKNIDYFLYVNYARERLVIGNWFHSLKAN